MNSSEMKSLREVDQRRYVMVCCANGDGNRAMSDDALAFILRISIDEWMGTKAILVSAGLILDDLTICHWGSEHSSQSARLSSEQWRLIRERIFFRDNYTCAYCGAFGVHLECDHIHPLSRGGGNDDENLTTACYLCNRSKGAKTVSEWRGAANG